MVITRAARNMVQARKAAARVLEILDRKPNVITKAAALDPA